MSLPWPSDALELSDCFCFLCPIPFYSSFRCDDDTHYTITIPTFPEVKIANRRSVTNTWRDTHTQYEEGALGVVIFLSLLQTTSMGYFVFHNAHTQITLEA